jgi:hypothetical protein
MRGLSEERVRELMGPKRGKLDEATDAVFERLMKSDFEGDAQELAGECGIELHWLRAALDRVRTPEWINENQWTIPFVQRGAWSNVWYIADSTNADVARMEDSQQGRAREILRSSERNVSQCDVVLASLPDKRTRVYRDWRDAKTMHEAAVAHMRLLVESFDEK